MIDFAVIGSFIVGAIISIIIISNPISTSAVFMSLTDGMSRKDKKGISARSVKFSFFILIFFALTGFYVFQLFGFSIGAFRIAGGILLFTTAVHMFSQKHTHKEAAKLDYNEISLMPLSVPFTAGPGTIVTVVLLASEAINMMNTAGFLNGLISIMGVYLAIIILMIVSYFMMLYSQKIDKVIKEGGHHIITRLMGLLVMAIAIQFMINGVIDIIPDLIAAAGII